MNKQEEMYGIAYSLPKVILLQHTGIGVPEIAARTCYDSFDNSENTKVQELNELYKIEDPNEYILNHTLNDVNNINHSNLLDDLAWTYFHHSILEHTNLSFLIKGTSRGVLQEHARHRIQAISVRSTRYTMSNVINAFIASFENGEQQAWFLKKIKSFNMFIVNGWAEELEINQLFEKFMHYYMHIGRDTFINQSISKGSLDFVINIKDADTLFNTLQEGKKKRNVGDAFKWAVTDNWKVDMVVTMNLRALKNYFTLRDSGAAYFQIKWLAQEMKEVTPKKYLDLIIKSK